MAEVSIPAVAALAEEFIKEDLSVELDRKFMSSEALYTSLSPAGLFNGVTPLTPGADSLADIRLMMHQMAVFRARRPVWILDQLSYLALLTERDGDRWLWRFELERDRTLMGLPFIVSSNITDKLAIIDAGAIHLAAPLPSVDVSASASLVMLDADGNAPMMSANGPVSDHVDEAGSVKVSDAAGAAGGPAEVHGMFQQNATAIRILADGISWGKMHPDAVAHVVPGWN